MAEDGVFFRPEEVMRERGRIPAALFNRCRLIYRYCDSATVVLPIHAMQYQAAIDAHEIYFVDIHAYAVRDGRGGKLITLAWMFEQGLSRDSLNEPIDFDLVYYHHSSRAIHQRLMAEFPKALDRAEQRMKETGCNPPGRKVLRFPS